MQVINRMSFESMSRPIGFVNLMWTDRSTCRSVGAKQLDDTHSLYPASGPDLKIAVGVPACAQASARSGAVLRLLRTAGPVEREGPRPGMPSVFNGFRLADGYQRVVAG